MKSIEGQIKRGEIYETFLEVPNHLFPNEVMSDEFYEYLINLTDYDVERQRALIKELADFISTKRSEYFRAKNKNDFSELIKIIDKKYSSYLIAVLSAMPIIIKLKEENDKKQVEKLCEVENIYREVKVTDVNETILHYCLEIPKEGIPYTMYPAGHAWRATLKPIENTEARFSLKSYSNSNGGIASTTKFVTADGKTYIAKGDWVIKYLKSAGYVLGAHLTPNICYYNDAEGELKNRISGLLNVDPFPVEMFTSVYDNEDKSMSRKK